MTTARRYSSAAIILHWAMAIGIVLMLCTGLSMEYIEMPRADKFWLVQLHKSIGVLVLVALALRLIVRLRVTPPALPAAFKAWERKASKMGHGGLYMATALMLLSGWTIVSSSSYGLPTMVFNTFEWPHIPFIAANETINEFAEETHYWTVIVLGILLAAHIGAVFKHAIFDRENLLRRMWWGKQP